jgi:hypothetical protein
MSSLDWPSRSVIREICGATTALVRVKVAATAPPSQYPPCVWEIIVTIPIGAMATGSRARNPAAAKPIVPGGRKIAR